MASVVDEVADGLRSVTEPRGQRLVVDAPRPLPARVDEDKLLSIVSNLLSNAVKFTPPAGLVRCTLASTGGGVHLEVADSGPGIPPAEREAVFERFHQVGGNGSARRAGTGLGLAIVRELVELHGGTIAVHDSPEGGASFVVDLPSQAVAPRRTAGSRLDVTERQRPALEAHPVQPRVLRAARIAAHHGGEWGGRAGQWRLDRTGTADRDRRTARAPVGFPDAGRGPRL